MIRLPNSLRTLTEERLGYFLVATERDLKKEMDRVSKDDMAFARALRQALAVEAEIEWRIT